MKFIARFLTFNFLHLSLSLFVLSATIAFIATDRGVISSTLAEADVYENIVPALIDNFDTEEADSNKPDIFNEEPPVEGFEGRQENMLSFDDPEIRKIFEDSITPEILQTEIEGVLKDVYAWLEGEQEKLTFEINLTQVRANLTENISNYVVNRVDALPECTSIEQAQSTDIFSLDCRPPGFNAAEAESEIQQGVSEFELFEDSKITEETIQDNNDDEKSLEEQLEPVRNVYSSLSPGFYGVSALLFAAIVVFMLVRMPVGNAITALGKNLFGVGIVTVVTAYIGKLIIPGRLEMLVDGEGQIADIGARVAEVYIDKNVTFVIMVAAVIAAIGFVAMAPHHLKKLTAGSKHKK